MRTSLGRMGDLRLVELSASTIVAVNNMSLKPGQEQFLAPVSYGVAATVVNPQTTWQRVVVDDVEVVGFVSANFDTESPIEHFRSVLWRINVDADDQGRRGHDAVVGAEHAGAEPADAVAGVALGVGQGAGHRSSG